ERRVFLRWLDDERKLDVAGPIDHPAIYGRELWCLDAVKEQHLFASRLFNCDQETGRTRARITQVEQIEQRRDVRFERALSRERLGEVDDEIRTAVGQLVYQRLDGVVHHNAARLVTRLAQRSLDLTEYRILLALDCIFRVKQCELHQSSPRGLLCNAS